RVRLRDQLIRVGTDLAYEVGIEEGEATLAGERVSFKHRVTNIYRREGGGWKMVHHHTDASPAMNDLVRPLQPPPSSAGSGAPATRAWETRSPAGRSAGSRVGLTRWLRGCHKTPAVSRSYGSAQLAVYHQPHRARSCRSLDGSSGSSVGAGSRRSG